MPITAGALGTAHGAGDLAREGGVDEAEAPNVAQLAECAHSNLCTLWGLLTLEGA